MKKNLRTVKTTIILGLLLVSIFAVFGLNASAGPIKVNSVLQVTFDEESAKQEVIPNTKFIAIGLDIYFEISGVGAGWVADNSLLSTSDSTVDLKVVSAPEWCVATITPPVVILDISTSFTNPRQAALFISANENAPAFTQGKVMITVHSTKLDGLLFSIKEHTLEVEIPFNVGYSPAISINTPEGTYLEIGPMDTAEFRIDITNLGNAKTEVLCQVLDAPDGWSANIITNVVLNSKVFGSDADTTQTIYFKIKPPFTFGYHNDRQQISVKLTPSYLWDPTLEGKVYQIDFVVQSRGFSTPGFELPLIAAALIGIALIYKIRKKNKE
ncbi:MAG: hypothetical protein KAW45_05340 [Thermoplasmatales archaeon]|nr:hypothetical protein [Thermoplasmatales archaeon]